MASLFLGGTPYLINWYTQLMSYISPVLDKTIQILAEPQTISLSVLFVEKILKILLASLISGGVCFYFSQFKSVKNQFKNKLLYSLFIGSFSYSLYCVLTDFNYIRKLATTIAAHNLIYPLVASQLGRMTLVIGSMLFMKQFAYIPGTLNIFVILLYGLGVYSLAFRL